MHFKHNLLHVAMNNCNKFITSYRMRVCLLRVEIRKSLLGVNRFSPESIPWSNIHSEKRNKTWWNSSEGWLIYCSWLAVLGWKMISFPCLHEGNWNFFWKRENDFPINTNEKHIRHNQWWRKRWSGVIATSNKSQIKGVLFWFYLFSFFSPSSPASSIYGKIYF